MAFGDYLLSCLLNGLYLMGLGVLPYIILAFFMQTVSNSLRKGIGKGAGGTFLLYLTSPGVVVHELGHIFFCFIFGHKILDYKLFENDEKQRRLGYVNHRYNPNSYYQRIGNFFIGTGPVWFGVACIFILSRILLPSDMFWIGDDLFILLKKFFRGFLEKEFWVSWKTWVWIYLCFSIASHVSLSRSDLTGAKDGLFLLTGVIFICSLLLGWYGQWEDTLIRFQLYVFVMLLAMMIAFSILVILPVFMIRCLLRR